MSAETRDVQTSRAFHFAPVRYFFDPMIKRGVTSFDEHHLLNVDCRCLDETLCNSVILIQPGPLRELGLISYYILFS